LRIPIIIAFLLVFFAIGGCEKDTVKPPDDGPSDNSGWVIQNDLPTEDNLKDVGVFGTDTVIAVGDSGAILKTTDGGNNWTLIASGTEEHLRGLFLVEPNIALAVGYGGAILKTTDAGNTWESKNSGTTINLRDLFFADANTGWVGGGPWGSQPGTGTILKTTDQGVTWDSLTLENTINGLCFVDTDTGWGVGGSGTIIKTTDGGSTWTPQVSGAVNYFGDVFLLMQIPDGLSVGVEPF
jgi:photosystem II stability/assembly factor-like uncharacterized protein